jgi:hypothetical protein
MNPRTHILQNASGGDSFTATGAGLWLENYAAICTFEAALSNTTAPTATVEIHGSNSDTTTPGAGTLMGTLTLSGASDVASLSKDAAAYRHKCAKVTSISGASAAVSVTLGV